MFKLDFLAKTFGTTLGGDLILCDPCDPGNGKKITLAPGFWEIETYSEACPNIWSMKLVEWPGAKGLMTIPTYTNTGVIALTDTSFAWDLAEHGIRSTPDDVFAGNDYFAFNMGGAGQFYHTAWFTTGDQIIWLNCFKREMPKARPEIVRF